MNYRLPSAVVPTRYDIRLEPDLDTATFVGEETITVTVKEPVAERARFLFPTSIEPGEYRLRLSFTGVLNDRLHGFYRSTYKDAGGVSHTIAATQFESTDARRGFPCWDEPAFKAVFGVTLVVPDGLAAVSNCAVIREEP